MTRVIGPPLLLNRTEVVLLVTVLDWLQCGLFLAFLTLSGGRVVLERTADGSGGGGLQTRTFSQPSRPSAVFHNNKKEKYP